MTFGCGFNGYGYNSGFYGCGYNQYMDTCFGSHRNMHRYMETQMVCNSAVNLADSLARLGTAIATKGKVNLTQNTTSTGMMGMGGMMGMNMGMIGAPPIPSAQDFVNAAAASLNKTPITPTITTPTLESSNLASNAEFAKTLPSNSSATETTLQVGVGAKPIKGYSAKNPTTGEMVYADETGKLYTEEAFKNWEALAAKNKELNDLKGLNSTDTEKIDEALKDKTLKELEEEIVADKTLTSARDSGSSVYKNSKGEVVAKVTRDSSGNVTKIEITLKDGKTTTLTADSDGKIKHEESDS